MDQFSLLVALLALAIAVGAFAVIRSGRSKGGELSGRIAQMGEAQAAAQAQINMTLESRLDAVSKRIGDGLDQHTEKTSKTISDLHQRLAVIDAAQQKITSLSEQMVSLQDILSNKQVRGAFGEIQLNSLVTSMMPPSAYDFQATLSNNKRADCLLKLPNPPGPIVIDAKFPLENYHALRNAADEAARAQAGRAFSADILKHVRDINEKYIIAGETAESALMFLPSEAVYAELHAGFPEVVEKSFKFRVWIVSPTTLMATLHTIRAVLKDATMHEQAGLIQAEVMKLLEDVGRMDKRVSDLDRHFTNANKVIREIQISSGKVTRRGARIEDMQLGEDGTDEEAEPPRLVPIPGGKE